MFRSLTRCLVCTFGALFAVGHTVAGTAHIGGCQPNQTIAPLVRFLSPPSVLHVLLHTVVAVVLALILVLALVLVLLHLII